VEAVVRAKQQEQQQQEEQQVHRSKWTESDNNVPTSTNAASVPVPNNIGGQRAAN
jgi:hypothetical protein